MSSSTPHTFDDSLLLVNFSKSSALVEGFFDLLKQKMTGPNLTFHVQEDGEDQCFYFESVNKYFSARINILFGDESSFAMHSIENGPSFENCVFVIDSIEDWAAFNSNLKVLQLLRKSQKFKTLIVSDKILGKININQFYDIIESYISVFGFSSEEGSSESNDNEDTVNEVIDMLANNVWNHSANSKSKASKEPNETKDEAGNEDALLKFKEKNDEGFLNAFEQIMSFKNESANLSPKSRKLKACEIMMSLVNTFENEEFDDFECPADDDLDGYSKFS